MRIKNDQSTDADSTFMHLLIKALLQAEEIDPANHEKLLAKWHEKAPQGGFWDVDFKLEGIDINIEKVMQDWEDQVDRMVMDEAKKLVDMKLGDLFEVMNTMTDDMRRVMSDKIEEVLGVKLSKDE